MSNLYRFSQKNEFWSKFFNGKAVIHAEDYIADRQLCELLELFGFKVLGRDEYNNYTKLCRSYGSCLSFQVEYSTDQYYNEKGIEILEYKLNQDKDGLI